ncbi:hypothetical protein COL516b_011356 [Colletotrichum fioriniae]|nr:uncharacterized protein COL516b_011356 [Colletotrichum fioriniae]KAJ0296656.1 hypothetical protein COL516b_011356 [Colletotrichum fioriniae]
MQSSFFLAALLAAVVPAFAYEVGTGSCCTAQLKACHEQGADACIWTNAAICVNNPKNSVPIDETCNEQCPTASVKTPDGFIYKFQKHNAPAGTCVCSNTNPNVGKYCYGRKRGQF